MPASFQEYWGTQKPKLDEGFRRQISLLLANIPLKQTASLLATLEAGKKIRGCLVCLISDALGGELEAATHRAIAVELIQAATLIHDDFVDQDNLRGKRAAAWTLEGARRAVLIGDVMFASAIKMMNDLSCEDGRAVSHAIAQVSGGALHEPLDPLTLAQEIKGGGFKNQIYDRMIQLKTGILFATACQLGALAAEADDPLRKISFLYGLRIGEAYQMADDLKEVEHHLGQRNILPGEMAALAPALLHFVPELNPYVLFHLQGADPSLGAAAAEFFRAAAGRMKDQIEQRLRSAVSAISGIFPENEYRPILSQAPWDLIRMFNES